jgi:CPA2 family monovalent cation:H+ antiporter-2
VVGVAAASGDTAVVFIETGAVVVGLAFLARIADRARISAVPLYVVAGLAVGEGGLAPLDVSGDFIRLVGDIGALLLLLMLGLAYSPEELRTGLASGIGPGVVNGVVNFVPGLAIGLILGSDIRAAFLLGGVCWVSSSGVVAKVLADLGRLGNRETPAVLNLLVLEDLAMAVFLPVAGGVVTGGGVAASRTWWRTRCSSRRGWSRHRWGRGGHGVGRHRRHRSGAGDPDRRAAVGPGDQRAAVPCR